MQSSPSPTFPDTSQLPRLQAIALAKAAKDCGWAAKTVQEWQGVQGQEPSYVHNVTPMFGSARPEFAGKMSEFAAKFGTAITAANYVEVLNEITNLTVWFQQNPVVSDKRITLEEHNRRQEQLRQSQEATRKAEELGAAKQKQLAAITPPGAGAYVLAELHQDESDHQSDYFGHSTTRQVLIGFRTGGREDFRQLRRAAALFPQTSHLGPECAIFYGVAKDTEGNSIYLTEDGRPAMFSSRHELTTQAEAEKWLATIALDPARFPHGGAVKSDNIEHRENYSMGSGNYLKAGFSNSSGWCVKSRPIGELVGSNIANLEIAPHLLQKEVSAPKAKVPEKTPLTGAAEVRFNLEKGGVEIHFAEKPDSARLDQLRNSPFRWSRFSNCWWAKRTAETEKIAYELAGLPAPTPPAPHPARVEPAVIPIDAPATGEPFRGTIQRTKTLAQFLEENPKVHYQVTREGSHVITLNGVPSDELYVLVDFRVSTVAGPVRYMMPVDRAMGAPNPNDLGEVFNRVEKRLEGREPVAISHG